MSAEVQAFINEIEAQRNELGARAAKHAAANAVLKRRIAEQEKTIADLRADIMSRDNQRPAEPW